MANLVVLQKSRKKLRPGDIFVQKFSILDKYIWGRVISTTADAGPFGLKNLIYIYHVLTTDIDDIPELKKNNLLIPPLLTNRLGWSRGYYKTIANMPLTQDDVYQPHCFHFFSMNQYRDENAMVMDKPCPPVGSWAMTGYIAIEAEICRTLNLPFDPSDHAGVI